MNISPWGIVGLRVLDHEPEIGLESGPVFVEATVELCTHGTQVHRIFNDLEVTGPMLISVIPQNRDPERTLGPYPGRDPRVGERAWHVYELAVSLERFCKPLSRTPTFQRTETSARVSSCPSPSPASGA